MKRLTNFALLMFFTTCLLLGHISCKKDTNSALYTLDGKWLGAYYYTGNMNENFIGFNFKAGGDLDVLLDPNNKYLVGTTGTWTMVNDEVTLIVPVSNSKLTATFNPKVGALTGTWGNNPSASDKGTWTVTKQ